MRKGVPKAHNGTEIEMPMIRSSMESELQFIAAGATAASHPSIQSLSQPI